MICLRVSEMVGSSELTQERNPPKLGGLVLLQEEMMKTPDLNRQWVCREQGGYETSLRCIHLMRAERRLF